MPGDWRRLRNQEPHNVYSLASLSHKDGVCSMHEEYGNANNILLQCLRGREYFCCNDRLSTKNASGESNNREIEEEN